MPSSCTWPLPWVVEAALAVGTPNALSTPTLTPHHLPVLERWGGRFPAPGTGLGVAGLGRVQPGPNPGPCPSRSQPLRPMGAIPTQTRQPGHAQPLGQQRQKNQLGAFCSAHYSTRACPCSHGHPAQRGENSSTQRRRTTLNGHPSHPSRPNCTCCTLYTLYTLYTLCTCCTRRHRSTAQHRARCAGGEGFPIQWQQRI